MRTVVVGGSGLIGSKLVAALTRDGHEVVPLHVDLDSTPSPATSPSFQEAAVMKFFKT